LVALGLLAQDSLEGCLDASCLEFGKTAARPDLGTRNEEELGLCLGKHDAARVTALDTNASLRRKLPLQAQEPLPNQGMPRNPGGTLAHLGSADCIRHLAVAHKDPMLAILQKESNVECRNKSRQALLIIVRNPALCGNEGEGAVDGTRVKECITEADREQSGNS